MFSSDNMYTVSSGSVELKRIIGYAIKSSASQIRKFTDIIKMR